MPRVLAGSHHLFVLDYAPRGGPAPPRSAAAAAAAAGRSSTSAGDAQPAGTVLLLHGFPDSAALWEPVVPALTAAGYRVLVPDMLGYASSDKPLDPEPYTLRNIVAGLLAAMDALGVGKLAAVVGHDWGAATAWRLAYAAPRRVQRLAVLSVGHPGGGVADDAGGTLQRQKWWYMLLLSHPDAASAIRSAGMSSSSSSSGSSKGGGAGRGSLVAASNNNSHCSAPASSSSRSSSSGTTAQQKESSGWGVLRGLLAQGGPDGGRAADSYIASLRASPEALAAALNWYRANVPLAAFLQQRMRPFPPVPCPVLGMWGSDDPALTEGQMTASAAYVLPGRWRYVRCDDGAGHWLPRDRPNDVARELLALLRRPGLDELERSGGGASLGGSGRLQQQQQQHLRRQGDCDGSGSRGSRGSRLASKL